MLRILFNFLDVISYYIRHELFRYKKDTRAKIIRCPVCGYITLNQNYICPNCKWEEDGHTKVEDYSRPSYPNGNLNVYEYRQWCKENNIRLRSDI